MKATVRKGMQMELLQNIGIFIAAIAVWFALQRWILPMFGVPT